MVSTNVQERILFYQISGIQHKTQVVMLFLPLLALGQFRGWYSRKRGLAKDPPKISLDQVIQRSNYFPHLSPKRPKPRFFQLLPPLKEFYESLVLTVDIRLAICMNLELQLTKRQGFAFILLEQRAQRREFRPLNIDLQQINEVVPIKFHQWAKSVHWWVCWGCVQAW